MAGKKVKLRLQGHEKFALREGWINKALMILPEHPDAFTRKDATDLSRADQSILIPFIYSSISGNSTSLPTAHC